MVTLYPKTVHFLHTRFETTLIDFYTLWVYLKYINLNLHCFPLPLYLQQGAEFTKTTIMPVCLPDPDFKDTSIHVTAVGVGLLKQDASKTYCTTDGNGPEPFSRCANIWTLNPSTG